jgi:hypothetical protein
MPSIIAWRSAGAICDAAATSAALGLGVTGVVLADGDDDPGPGFAELS